MSNWSWQERQAIAGCIWSTVAGLSGARADTAGESLLRLRGIDVSDEGRMTPGFFAAVGEDDRVRNTFAVKVDAGLLQDGYVIELRAHEEPCDGRELVKGVGWDAMWANSIAPILINRAVGAIRYALRPTIQPYCPPCARISGNPHAQSIELDEAPASAWL